MAGSKRERELARQKYERQQERRAAEAAKRKRRNTIIAAVAGVLVVGAGLLWLLRPSTTTPAAAPTPVASPTAPASPSASASPVAAVCPAPPAPRPDDKSWPTAPPNTLKAGATYTIDLHTNCGDIAIAVESKAAPQTANSMVFLTDQKFFDDTACHRLTTAGIFVLQCGDPKGTGSGGPGYTVPDENLPKGGTNDYPAGTVAMANSGANTNGSQFFLVYKDTTLGPNYTIWGHITKGLDVVRKVAAQGVQGGGGDGKPAQPISILTGKTTVS